jgi:hypothetical protein
MRNSYLKKKVFLTTAFSALITPVVVDAQTGKASELLFNLYHVVFNPLVVLMVVISLIVFVWGVIEWIAGAANEEKVAIGKRHVVYGIVGLFIIAGVWAILNTICRFIGAC